MTKIHFYAVCVTVAWLAASVRAEPPRPSIEELIAQTVTEYRPAEYWLTERPVTLLDPGVWTIATADVLLPELGEIVTLDAWTPLAAGDVVHESMIWNLTAEPVRIQVGDSEAMLQPMGMMIIGPDIRDVGGCEVTCDSNGYYACCWVDGNGVPHCRCWQDQADDTDCTAGGHGATECAINSATQRLEPRPGEPTPR